MPMTKGGRGAWRPGLWGLICLLNFAVTPSLQATDLQDIAEAIFDPPLNVERQSRPIADPDAVDKAMEAAEATQGDEFFIDQQQKKQKFFDKQRKARKEFYQDLREKKLLPAESRRRSSEFQTEQKKEFEKFFSKQREAARKHVQKMRENQ